MQSEDLSDYVILFLLGALGFITLLAVIYLVYKQWKGEDPFDGIF